MNKKETIKLYNVIFPIWLILLFPFSWIIVLPANFLIDSVVVLIALKLLKITDYIKTYKRIIFKVWILGFLADFVGVLFMFLSNLIDSVLNYQTAIGAWWYNNISSAVSYNPFKNIYSVLWVTAAIAITALVIFIFNYKISLKNINMENADKKKLALSLAIFTAPYLFYLPTSWFY